MKNLKLYQELHKQRLDYGEKKIRFSPGFMKEYLQKHSIRSILDYGCGKTDNSKEYPVDRFYRYDPAIEGINCLPNVASVDLVLCTDVLEHIPIEELHNTLYRIRSYSHRTLFTIALFKAKQLLSNGESAHCTVESAEWWEVVLRGFSFWNGLYVIEKTPRRLSIECVGMI